MKLRIFFLAILFSFIIFGTDQTNLLISPLSFKTYLTSSFGEYRFNHFHGGVDFSTNQEEGKAVLAVGDGKILRVRREPYGYGRVLYLELNDGRTAVYGHLIRFSRELGIEKKLIEECKKRGTSFPGDIYFSPPIDVKKGDVVAFSGELGIGSPHLHLEIRKGDELCDPIKDGIPFDNYSTPEINSLYIVPIEEGAKVNNSFYPQKIGLSKKGNGRYTFNGNISVEGKVDLFLDVSDSMGVSTYKTFPCEIEGKIDSEPFFYLNLKSVSLSHYKESPYLFEIIDGKSYIRMRKSEKLTLNEIRGEGILPSEGKKKIEIIVKNRGGKVAALEGMINFSENKNQLVQFIPYDRFKIEETNLYQNGVAITIVPFTSGGKSEIYLNERKVSFFSLKRNGKIEIVIPKSFLSKGVQKIKIGQEKLDDLFCRGKEKIVSGKFTIEILEDILARIKDYGNSIEIDVSPKGMTPFVTLSSNSLQKNKEAIYAGKTFFSYLNSKPKNLFKAKRYNILVDDKPPVFEKVYISTIANILEKELRIEVKDNLSGIAPNSMKMFVDGEEVYPDWDGDDSTIRIDLTDTKRGEHYVKGEVRDRMGNLSTLLKTKFFL